MHERERMISSIIDARRNEHGSLLSILEEVQRTHEHNYLPKDELILVARSLGIPLSEVYSVATFYAFFNLKPQGKHVITVCRGTACHTRGSKPLLEQVLRALKIELDDDGMATTEDFEFTVHTVACFGQCALAPVIALDGVIHSLVTEQRLSAMIETLRPAKEES
jgi:NADH-quinone oxidoreductase subunit E